jgi:DNA polymerase (family 10)
MPDPPPTNREVAARLQLLGDLLEIEGGPVRHRVVAYRRAADQIRSAGGPVARMALEGRAVELPGIGPTIQAKIVELAETGEIGALARLRERVPEGLVRIAALRGIGPRRALAVWRELGVSGPEELAEAAKAGRLRGVAGFGPRTEAAVLEQLAAGGGAAGADGGEPRMSLGRALALAEDLARDLALAEPGARVAVAGSVRRGAELVGDIDLVAGTDAPERVHAAFAAHQAVESVVAQGAARSAVMLHAGLRAELQTGPLGAFGNLLQHATGSAAHNLRLRQHAARRGLSVSERGVLGSDGTLTTHAEEDDVYAALGLAPIPPELREDRGEIEAALAGVLPRLVEHGDLVGDLHVHSDWSDGRETIAAMAAAARERGYAYLGISDHSQSLRMAGGLEPDRVRRQWELIDQLNARDDGIRILKATEVDILTDGRIDFDDDLLAGFDWVTASLHSGFSQDARRLTERVLAAIESPHVDAIGHPTGRMLGRREAAPLDLDRVLEAAARTGTFLEINSQPRRLDLNEAMAREALRGGVRLVIGSDAHGAAGLDLVRLGVAVARRAGAGPADIGNARGWDELAAMRAG